jgi:hypothetical protein
MNDLKVYTRRELYDLVWNSSISRISKEFGMSDKGLAKICIKHNIPRPPLGYWAKVQNGQNPKRTPLPTIKDKTPDKIQIKIRNSYGAERLLAPGFKVEERLLDKAHKFQQPANIKKYHAIISAARKAKLDRNDRYGRLLFNWREADIGLRVTAATYSRACLFLESLVRFCESIGWKYKVQKSAYGRESGSAVFMCGDSELSVEIKEAVRQVNHKTQPQDRDAWWTQKYDYLPTGQLQFSILVSGAGFQSTWKDSSKQRVEDKFAAIIESMAKAFEYKIRLKERQEQQRREFEKRQEEHKKVMRLAEIKKHRRELLLSSLEKYERASALKNFIADIEERSASNAELSEWLEWARNVADEIDPVKDIESLLENHRKVGEKEQSYLFI